MPIPAYKYGYKIEYSPDEDVYRCLKDGKELLKKGGTRATYKSLVKAKKFLVEQGAERKM